MLKDNAWKWIDEHQKELIEVSDRIWGYAELDLCQDMSSRLLTEKLKGKQLPFNQ